MITVVYEDMIIGSTINNLPTAPCESSSISKDNSKKVANSNIFPSIILTQENPHEGDYNNKQNQQYLMALRKEIQPLALRCTHQSHPVC